MSTHAPYRQGALPIIFVQPHGPSFKGLMEKFSQDSKIQVFECKTQMEVVTLLPDLPCALVLLFAGKSEEVTQHTQMLKLIHPQIKKNRVRVVFNTSIQQVKALTQMNYYGTAETITEPIAARAFLFKLQRHIKAITQDNAEKISGTAKNAAQDSAAARANARDSRKEEKQGPKIRYIDAIGIASDCWLSSKAQIKQIGKRWVIKLIGPGPSSGVWTKVKGDETIWQWKPHLPSGPTGQDPFVRDEGAWVFRGQRPDFQDDVWWFISNSPELMFLNGSDTKASKMKFERESGTLLLAKDSVHAGKLMPQIRASVSNKARALNNQNHNGAAGGKRQGADAQIEWMPALKIKSDCWLFEEKMPRRINGRWAIRMTGPGPSAGRWQEAKETRTVDNAHSAERETHWHWLPKEPKNNPFIQENGTWVYHGRQPKFEGDHWLFVADQPSLGFFVDAQLFGSKFDLDPSKKLNAAKDSPQAIAKMPDIRRSHALVTKQGGKEGEQDEYGQRMGEDGQELAYGKGANRARGGPNDETRLPRGAFGDPQGIWEKANEAKSGRVWAVFVRAAWMESLTLEALRASKSFYVFKGPKMPYMDVPKIEVEKNSGEWVFVGSAPTEYTSFDELPAIARDFLVSLASAKEKEARGPARSAAISVDAGKSGTKEEDPSPEEGSDTSAQPRKVAPTSQEDPAENQETKNQETKNQEVVSLQHHTESTLSKFALFLSAAELCGAPEMGVEAAARKIAHYVSRFALGLRTEIWVQSGDGKWLVVATSDGRNGLFQRWAEQSVTEPTQKEGAWIIPIAGKGRVVLDAPRKDQASIPIEEVGVIAVALVGIVAALVQNPPSAQAAA